MCIDRMFGGFVDLIYGETIVAADQETLEHKDLRLLVSCITYM